VPSDSPSAGSLIPMRRKPDESDAVQDGHFLPDPTPTGHVEGDAAGELDSKSSVLRLFPLLSGRQLGAVDSFVDGFTHLRWRSQKSAWVSTLKACILAAKALSVASMWPSRPVLIAVIGLLAVLDPMFDGLEVTLVLGVLHLVIIRWC